MVALAALLAAGGCMTAPQRAALTAAAHRTPPPHPDLSGVMERYYQGVEDGRWALVYGMLSDRAQARIGRAALEARYAPYTDFDISARQNGDRVVVARIAAVRRDDRTRHVSIGETATLAWAGDRWVIDDMSPAAPR